MQILDNLPNEEWGRYCKRPAFQNKEITEQVKGIIEKVQQTGDKALKEYALLFDKTDVQSFAFPVPAEEPSIPSELKEAIERAIRNIGNYHSTQVNLSGGGYMMPGVKCWWEKRPVEKVGLYVPGGSAPLFSTLLMLVIPALLAGCKEIVVCTPPKAKGGVDSTLLYVAYLFGLPTIYSVGGAQAIAAMAYGTESIPKVDKIFGPGNQYVTIAKQLVQLDQVAIDMPAGPSEVLIIADDTCNPAFIAADLLSQAEHGVDSQVIFLSNSAILRDKVLMEIARQQELLPRKAIVEGALENSLFMLFEDIERCVKFSNMYAPEHLILAFEGAEGYTEKVSNAGSVFIGPYSCESAGDYASGTNHTLPTSGYARSYSGVTVDSFLKSISFQRISKEGLKSIAPSIIAMAQAEGLQAHANAVSIRL